MAKNEAYCYFCGQLVIAQDSVDKTVEDDYCHGCGEYVCEDCNENGPMGRHDVSAHTSPEFKGVWVGK